MKVIGHKTCSIKHQFESLKELKSSTLFKYVRSTVPNSDPGWFSFIRFHTSEMVMNDKKKRQETIDEERKKNPNYTPARVIPPKVFTATYYVHDSTLKLSFDMERREEELPR